MPEQEEMSYPDMVRFAAFGLAVYRTAIRLGISKRPKAQQTARTAKSAPRARKRPAMKTTKAQAL